MGQGPGANEGWEEVWYGTISPGEVVLVREWDVRAPVDAERKIRFVRVSYIGIWVIKPSNGCMEATEGEFTWLA